MQPASEPPQRLTAVFGAYLALAAAAALCALLTVHRRSPEWLQSNAFAQRAHWVVTLWQRHGYFASGGLIALPTPPITPSSTFYFYRSGSGAWYLPVLLAQNAVRLFGRGYDWSLTMRVNLAIVALTAALLALLCYRLALRLGALPLYAFVLGACVLAVHFTFPDVLGLSLELSAQGLMLPFCFAFLLLEEGVVAGERRRRILQAIAVFGIVYADFLTGSAFVASFTAVSLVLRRIAWRDWMIRIAAPAAAALLLFAMQVLVAHVSYPQVPLVGSTFKSRSGLDGDTTYYRDHADIFYGRGIARANFENHHDRLFLWPTLFVAGTASLLAMLFLYARRRVPPSALAALTALTGSYVLYAAVFSQATVIHPYLFDMLLATPMILALFGLVPAACEAVTENRGAVTLLTLFTAFWYVMVQLRDYALRYPW